MHLEEATTVQTELPPNFLIGLHEHLNGIKAFYGKSSTSRKKAGNLQREIMRLVQGDRNLDCNPKDMQIVIDDALQMLRKYANIATTIAVPEMTSTLNMA